MNDDLDALIARVDPDRWLSSRFVADAEARADVIAIYAFDYELARAPRVASSRLLGEIRLAWWREAVDEIYQGRPPRAHPAVQALAQCVGRRGISRASLDAMIEARDRELDPEPMTDDERLAWAVGTGGTAAELCATILGAATPADANPAGTLWALARVAPDLIKPLHTTAQAVARRLPTAAFPAVAHAALTRARSTNEIARRARLIWAVATGRI